jgi:hypothetical protein
MAVGVLPRWLSDTHLSAKFGISFADKRRSLYIYSIYSDEIQASGEQNFVFLQCKKGKWWGALLDAKPQGILTVVPAVQNDKLEPTEMKGFLQY